VDIDSVDPTGSPIAARTLTHLTNALTDQDPQVRIQAALALGELRSTESVEPLISALGDGEENVQMYVADALGEIRDARAVRPLMHLLQSPSRSSQREHA